MTSDGLNEFYLIDVGNNNFFKDFNPDYDQSTNIVIKM